MKKLLALLLCAVLCLSLAACASNTATTTTTTEPAASTETAAETPAAEETAEAPAEEDPDAKQYVVGICQLVQHDALDAATNGFMDALNEALPVRSHLISKTLPMIFRPAARLSPASSPATST